MTEFEELKITYGNYATTDDSIQIKTPKVQLIPIVVKNNGVDHTFNLNVLEAEGFYRRLRTAIDIVHEENYERKKHNLAVERREEAKQKEHPIDGDLVFL